MKLRNIVSASLLIASLVVCAAAADDRKLVQARDPHRINSPQLIDVDRLTGPEEPYAKPQDRPSKITCNYLDELSVYNIDRMSLDEPDIADPLECLDPVERAMERKGGDDLQSPCGV